MATGKSTPPKRDDRDFVLGQSPGERYSGRTGSLPRPHPSIAALSSDVRHRFLAPSAIPSAASFSDYFHLSIAGSRIASLNP